jgi:hypothetical protein
LQAHSSCLASWSERKHLVEKLNAARQSGSWEGTSLTWLLDRLAEPHALVVGAVRCQLVRWVGDEPQPGLVEAQLQDVHGRYWTFVDKWPIFTSQSLSASSSFPVEGALPCQVGSDVADSAGAIVAVMTFGNIALFAGEGEAVVGDRQLEMLRHLELVQYFACPQADLVLPPQRPALALDSGLNLGQQGFGGSRQLGALACSFLCQRSVPARRILRL